MIAAVNVNEAFAVFVIVAGIGRCGGTAAATVTAIHARCGCIPRRC